MATVHPSPPAPPPPLPPSQKPSIGANTAPSPQHAALPFPYGVRYPTQETGGQPDAHGDPQAGGALSEKQEDAPSEDDQKCHPVQETNPAPQTNGNPQPSEVADVEQDGVVSQVNEAED